MNEGGEKCLHRTWAMNGVQKGIKSRRIEVEGATIIFNKYIKSKCLNKMYFLQIPFL